MDGYKFDTSFHPNQNQNGDMAQFCGSALSNQGESQLSYISTSNRIIIKLVSIVYWTYLDSLQSLSH